MSNILIIDGDPAFCRALMAEMARHELHAAHSTSLSKGLAMLHVGEFSLVLLGDEASDKNSLDFLATLREVPSRPEIIVISKNRDPDAAEAAIRSGAWNFMPKPVNMQRLMVLAQRALEYHRERPAKCAPVSLRREGIVGNSRLLNSCLDIVAQAASTDVNVLITGETGTGKELFARAIHANSSRAGKPFVVVDCAALPDTLVESMLFGHERGAFTSAENRSVGLIKQADGGTLFLDEVGELPLGTQKVFLRVLEGRSFRPVGGSKEITSNFRLVAATNRDLEAMVRTDAFRRDLFYRLRGIRLELSPLRDLLDDLNDLICHFVRRACARLNIDNKGFSPDFLDTLMQYEWPGNIRELVNALDQAVVRAGTEPILYPQHLSRNIRASIARLQVAELPELKERTPPLTNAETFPTLREYREKHMAELETWYLKNLMLISKGDIPTACRLSGLSRPRIYALLKERDVERNA
ncbi:MAG: sigma-54-dependent transcriptional regulator [Desulfomicrobium sp.]